MKSKSSDKTIGLVSVIILIIAAIYGLEQLKSPGAATDTSSPVSKLGGSEKSPAPDIVNPAGYINTDGISIEELKGEKVILVDFWTYSCINCQRTLPYLTQWYEKYEDKGLEIIGVHTPEFEFEKKYENVLAATEKFNVKYPVVLDNDYGTWRAYANRYWPRKYLIDINGDIVYDHIGEGAYEETESKIQELLKERSEVLGEEEFVESMSLTEDPKADTKPASPETYFGASRNSLLANGQAGVVGSQTLTIPDAQQENKLYLGGTWNITDEYAESRGPGKVVFKYQAAKVYMVARSDNPVVVVVRRNGEIVGEVIVQADQLYTLIDDNQLDDYTLELEVRDAGLQLFTFTFG